jgi:galactose mutarotase-like enzyme
MPGIAFCFESQQEPDSPSRGGAILRKGEIYRHRTVYEIKQI